MSPYASEPFQTCWPLHNPSTPWSISNRSAIWILSYQK
jgi:hypothetical protein